MIDATRERLLSVTEAAKRFPNRPHVATVWRWIKPGVGGVKLETIKVGGRRYTSEEAIERFIGRLNGRKPSTLRQYRRRQERIEKELEELGI